MQLIENPELEDLKRIMWEEGKHIPVRNVSYRYVLVIGCSKDGGHRAEFANWTFSYFCYMQTGRVSEWSMENPPIGGHIVPVLPDGRVLMIVEKRPPLSRFRRGSVLHRAGGDILLDDLDSPEFPGGGIKPGERVTAGLIRELCEESGATGKCTIYRITPPTPPFCSDMAVANYYAVAFLQENVLDGYIEHDGGLRVLTLTEDEVEANIDGGVLVSSHAVLTPWYLYQRVKRARSDPGFRERLERNGYLVVEETTL